MAELGAKNWYMKFEPGRWKQDPELSLCKPATRGIWMDALCAMHQLDERGEISGTVDDLARVCRCNSNEMRGAIADLKLRNAAEIEGDITVSADGRITVGNGDVTIRCRRMQREWNVRKSNRDRKLRFDQRHRNASSNGSGNAESTDHIVRGQSTESPHVPPVEFEDLIPVNLRSDEFVGLWAEFVELRHRLKHPLTSVGARRQLKKLEDWGSPRAIAAMNHSLAHDYRGIFEERSSPQEKSNAQRQRLEALRGQKEGVL